MSISVQEQQGGGGGGGGAAVGGSYLPAYRIQRASRSFDDGSSYEGDRPLSVRWDTDFTKLTIDLAGFYQ
jgi:hypothetical protein